MKGKDKTDSLVMNAQSGKRSGCPVASSGSDLFAGIRDVV